MAPPPLPDRTETFAPRASTGDPVPDAGAEPRRDVEVEVDGADDPDRYEQIGEHARGGLGRIVRAVDKRLGRTVAVKELLRHTESNEARFMREALITARLEHPGIVPVHEAGRWPNGDPYYVMKLVEGRTLKELIAERTTMRDRLALLPHVIAVADAVGYAHSEGVIHRDVKPSNIMVGAFGETIVVDWGLARDCKRDVPDPEDGEYASASGSGPLSTVSGKVIGTPAYMAPEQARGEIVDERADVYAIGAVLYELLAGSPAHQDTTPRATLERVIAGPPQPLCNAMPAVPSELGAIVSKAMARNPAERYANATSLAEDLRRYHTGKLVSAHSYSSWALLRKKLSQHRGVVAVAVASAVALGVVGVESFRRVVHERNIARQERGRTEDALAQNEKKRRELVLLQAVTSLRKDPTASIAWLKTYELDGADRAQVVNVIDEALALGVARHVFRPGDRVYDAVFTPDGKSLIASVREGELLAYDLETGRARRLGVGVSAAEVTVLAPDGKHVITGGKLGEVMSWPLAGGSPKTLLPSTGRVVVAIRFSDNSQKLLVEREKGDVIVIDANGAEPSRVGPKGALRTAVARDDWSKVAVSMAHNSIAAFENGALRPLGTTDKAIEFLALSPRGDMVLAHDGAVVWAVPFGGGPIKKLADYHEKLIGFEWSPDLKRMAIVGHGHDVVIVELESGTIRELRGHTDALYSVQWTRDGKRLLSASDDATARIWDFAEGTAVVLRGHDDDVYRARFSPDETQVVTASIDGSTRVWNVRSASAKTWFEGDDIVRLTLEGDTAVVRTPTTVSRWNVMTGEREPMFAWGQEKNLGSGYPSRSGELLAMPRADWSLELRRREAPPLVLAGHTGALTAIQFTRDDKLLYTASLDGTLRRWDTQTGAATTLIEGTAPVRGVAVAADGRVAVQVGEEARMIERDGSMHVLGSGSKWCIAYAEFDVVGDRLVLSRCDMSFAILTENNQVLELAADFVNRYSVSRDGTMLAGGMGDRRVIVWDLRSGKEIVVLRGHTDLVMDVAFSPDGTQLASASYDRTIRVWNLANMQHRVLRGHDCAVDQITWRDREHLVTGSRDGTIRLWDVPSMALPTTAELTARMAAATSAVIDVDRPTTADGSSGSS